MNENTINNDITLRGEDNVLLAGRYRIVRQLGQGGMWSVWLAEDTKLDGLKVAIKMLPSILINNKRAYQQVKQEALVSLKLVHSNIVAVRAFEEIDGNSFLVMDYIEGQTLDDYLAEKGTLMYMSPEQLNGNIPKPAQDVYSFAAMAYECLKGEPPFSRGQIEYQIEHDTPALLDSQFAKCGAGVMAGLAKLPEERPTTCAEVLSAKVNPRQSKPRDTQPKIADNGKQGKARFAALLLAALTLVGVGGWWLGAAPNNLNLGDTKTITLPGGAKMEMVWCPAGSFMMGSPASEESRDSDETQHKVTLTEGFWMGKYEVTQAQWESVMGSNSNHSNFKGSDRPVEQVSWDDCQEFIRKINASGAVTVSLPTEAQWEYACRAGTTTPFNFGSTLNGDKANCDGNYPYGTTLKGRYRQETASVGSYSPNAWGLYDMHGNVWEWCADWYGDYPTREVTNPTGPTAGAIRVNRGGSWYLDARYCRSADRGGSGPGYRFSHLGLRLVCSAAGPRR